MFHRGSWKIVSRFPFHRIVRPERIREFFAEQYGEYRHLAFYSLMTDLF